MFYRYDSTARPLDRDPFKACIVPRPIGWVSTIDVTGNPNLAPFSFFNAVSEQPPMVMFCANGEHVDGGEKDSVRNARQTGEFVVNLATWDLRDAVNASAASVPRAVNEFELGAVTPVASLMVGAPRVAESPINIECAVVDILTLPAGEPKATGRMVIGRVLGIHISDQAIVGGRVDAGRLRPIARLGYMNYAVVDSVFDMPRPGLAEAGGGAEPAVQR